jgi:hypothetical protein
LSINKTIINAILISKELFMRPLLNSLPFGEDYNLVCFSDGGEPMGDSNCSPILGNAIEGFLDQSFATDIN